MTDSKTMTSNTIHKILEEWDEEFYIPHDSSCASQQDIYGGNCDCDNPDERVKMRQFFLASLEQIQKEERKRIREEINELPVATIAGKSSFIEKDFVMQLLSQLEKEEK